MARALEAAGCPWKTPPLQPIRSNKRRRMGNNHFQMPERPKAPAAKWTPRHGKSPPMSPSSTLLVFDFDQTLTTVHMFHTLRTAAGQNELRRDKASFYNRIFGGPARVTALIRFCQDLRRCGCTLRILSFGYENEIRAALNHIDICDLFDGVYGNSSYAKHGVTTPKDSKQKMLAVFEAQDSKFSHILFADDDHSNFPMRNCAKFDPFTNEKADGDTTTLLCFPVRKSLDETTGESMEGLCDSDFDEIRNVVCGPETQEARAEAKAASSAPLKPREPAATAVPAAVASASLKADYAANSTPDNDALCI